MANQNQYGAFVPTNNIWDVSPLYSMNIDPGLRELLVRLYQNINTISLVLNVKDTGYYITDEYVNGQLYFPNPALTSASSTFPAFRQVFRKVINFGQLPNTATTSKPHGITCTPATTFTRIYATASDTTANNYIPIPFADTTAVANNISITVDATNVNITTGSNRTNFNTCYAILEFLQS